MDGQLVAIMLVGAGVGISFIGSVIARRRGPDAEERWRTAINGFRKFSVRLGLVLAASIVVGFLLGAGARALAMHLFGIAFSDNESMLYLVLPLAVVMLLWLWPKMSKVVV
jgi:hypothetical protein